MDTMLDHRPASHVLCLCRTLQAEFTLKDLVNRLTAERPEIVHLFADAWTTLLNSHLVRVRSLGDTTTYEVAPAPQCLDETGGNGAHDSRALTWHTAWAQAQRQAHDHTPGTDAGGSAGAAPAFPVMQWPWTRAVPWTAGRRE